MLRLLWSARVALFFTAFIWLLCLMPPKDLEVPAVLNGDKIFHFLVFGILCLLMIYALVRQTRFDVLRRYAYFYAFLYCALNGLCIEIVQHLWVPQRTGDWLDFVFDSAGALVLGAFYFPLAGRPIRRRPPAGISV
ncbi:MAG: VanZ family protein [Flavobacteriales bacterium]|nr:VanZ family protein [Flavobacteriales bacterium]MCX7649138.1 VanZ family protein [Flavobacteriales bacterium]MDW8432437.1 VanZ family protein [Flavobacteriales bacterium]